MDEQKELEKLMDKLFEEDHLESPSVHFTETVLQKIEAQKSTQLSYKPLLPKWVFVALGVLVVFFTVYVLQSTESKTPQVDYLQYLNSSGDWINNALSGINFSKTMGFTIVSLGLVICLQAKLLDRFLYGPQKMA